MNIKTPGPIDAYAWISLESIRRLKDEGGNSKGSVPVHGKQSIASRVPLYSAQALMARDAEWLALVGPLVEALKSMMEGSQYKTINGDSDWHSIAMPSRSSLAMAAAALANITKE